MSVEAREGTMTETEQAVITKWRDRANAAVRSLVELQERHDQLQAEADALRPLRAAVLRYGQALADEAAAKEAWLAAIRALPALSPRDRRDWLRGGKRSADIDNYRKALVKTELAAYDAKRTARETIGKEFDALALALAAEEGQD